MSPTLVFPLAVILSSSGSVHEQATEGPTRSDSDADVGVLAEQARASFAVGDHVVAGNTFRRAHALAVEQGARHETRGPLLVGVARSAREQHAATGNRTIVLETIDLLDGGARDAERDGAGAIASRLRSEADACRKLLATPREPPRTPTEPTDEAVDATIEADPELSKQWRRGSVFVGVGIPLVVVGGLALFGSSVVAFVTDFDSDGTALGLAVGGVVVGAAGGGFLGDGVRRRRTARSEARQRIGITFAPIRGGAGATARIRF